MKKNTEFTSFKDSLYEELKDPEYAIEYIQCALDEAKSNKEYETLHLAMWDVIQAMSVEDNGDAWMCMSEEI